MKTDTTSTEKFSGKADIYSKYRPAYPKKITEYISTFITDPRSTIADIGAGTGIFTKCLCYLGCNIICVEPNTDMLMKAAENLCNYEKVTFVRSPAEDTMLAENSVDLVTAAQAFHWFDAEKFRDECRRILKPNGKVMLLWNTIENGSELVSQINDISSRYCEDFRTRKGLNTPLNKSSEVLRNFFTEFDTMIFRNDLQYDMQGFIGNRLSRSYSPKESDENYEPYLKELKMLFDKHSADGKITVPNVTECYIGSV